MSADASASPVSAPGSRLGRLRPYPFEQLAALQKTLRPPPDAEPIALSIGEPQHPLPDFVGDAVTGALAGLSRYPATRGDAPLRETVAAWVRRRFGAALDAESQVLPVNGTREALFAFAQCAIDGSAARAERVLMPNPFYQIYEGAALLAGARPVFMNCPADDFLPDLDAVADADWERCGLVYVCTPGNPSGAVWPRELWRALLERADRYGFVVASDECYSEIYYDEPPPGLLQICRELGRDDYRRCVVFNSLSKRSSLPGLRSGFVAGDAALIAAFLKYRTYHGGAMSLTTQAVSVAAWSDERHVVANRALYRAKRDLMLETLGPVWPGLPTPRAGFFLWPAVPDGDDIGFAARLFERHNITVLPGRYIARDTAGADGRSVNPGAGRVRVALVAPPDDCRRAAERLADFIREQAGKARAVTPSGRPERP